MRRSAADALRQQDRTAEPRLLGLALSHRVLPIRRKALAAMDIRQLIVLQKIPGAEFRAPLEGDDIESGPRACVDEHSARRARPDHTDVFHRQLAATARLGSE